MSYQQQPGLASLRKISQMGSRPSAMRACSQASCTASLSPSAPKAYLRQKVPEWSMHSMVVALDPALWSSRMVTPRLMRRNCSTYGLFCRPKYWLKKALRSRGSTWGSRLR